MKQYKCNIELSQKFPIYAFLYMFPIYVFPSPIVGNTNIERKEGSSRVHNVYHEMSIFFGCITICLVMQFRCCFGKWRRDERERESAVASKIHVSLCVDVIRFRTWFHRIQVSWLREQIPLPHFLSETSLSCFSLSIWRRIETEKIIWQF